jgi:hypothetical protein
VAARDRVREKRPENRHDDADDDLREPTLHGSTMPSPDGGNMKRAFR